MSDGVVIGLGGNVGTETDVLARFRHAREALATLGELGVVSSARLYRSAPIGPAQPAFLNTAVRVQLTGVQPAELIATLQEIERLLGRAREGEVRWGPRPIDLDVLVWGARVLRSPGLDIPHPRLSERRFALAPLADLLGEEARVPGAGTIGDLLARVRAQALEMVVERW